MESKAGQEVIFVFRGLVKARILVDFNFYKAMNNCDAFVDQWCYEDALCTVFEDVLIFSVFFL